MNLKKIKERITKNCLEIDSGSKIDFCESDLKNKWPEFSKKLGLKTSGISKENQVVRNSNTA